MFNKATDYLIFCNRFTFPTCPLVIKVTIIIFIMTIYICFIRSYTNVMNVNLTGFYLKAKSKTILITLATTNAPCTSLACKLGRSVRNDLIDVPRNLTLSVSSTGVMQVK